MLRNLSQVKSRCWLVGPVSFLEEHSHKEWQGELCDWTRKPHVSFTSVSSQGARTCELRTTSVLGEQVKVVTNIYRAIFNRTLQTARSQVQFVTF